MKLIFAFISCIAVLNPIYGQKSAVTDNGEEVLLFDDGTWKYKDKEDSLNSEVLLNPKTFIKNESSNFLLKSDKINLGFWLNSKKWTFKKAESNADAEYELQLKNEDLYAMIITEKLEIPLLTLKSLAYTNAKSVAPDLKIVKEEYRMVNGLKVLHLQMNGTMQGVKFSYFGYYFTNSNGTVQFITYTSQNLLPSYIKNCEELLNGIVDLNK
jgi:hypothetical protein